MTQSSLSRPSYSGSDTEQKSDVEDYQVDSYSTSSCKELEADEDDEYDGTIALPGQPDVPHFGSVSVVNSNDVHFGNRTVYKGPVTIKQFVYPNGDITTSDNVPVLNECLKRTDLNSAVINNGYVKGAGDTDTNGSERGMFKDGTDSRAPETGTRKGFCWMKDFPKKRQTETILILSLIVVIAIVISAIALWRNPVTAIVSPDGKPYNPSSEEDNDKPIYYPTDSNETINSKVHIISRFTWLAQPAIEPINSLKIPVALVIVHHTATEICYSKAQCVYQTRHIQTFHIESNGWSDIGYNFLIGGDGDVYEGRGWKKEGAHTYGYNFRSLGIAFIGTFIKNPPPQNQISAFNKLLAKGVELGILTPDYKIMAARQFSGTESPGSKFFELIKTWSHWSNKV